MNLPGYIKDFLQVNYYVPDDELNLPFEQMPPHLQSLIKTKCFANEFDKKDNPDLEPVDPNDPDGNKFKDEEGILWQTNHQIEEDLNSDVRDWSYGQAMLFAKNHDQYMDFIDQARAEDKDPDDFDEVSYLLAAKRMAANDYKNKPLTYDTYKEAKEEIKVELQVKYWMAQYFNAKPATDDPNYQDTVVADMATIAEMIQNKEVDKIAAAFNLPTTPEALEEAKGGTLSVAMMEVRDFAKKVESEVKGSSYYKKAEELNNKFKEKYPKSYIATKLVGGIGAAVALGPVYSAVRAATGVNALRKGYAEYKEQNPNEKGSMWSFIKKKENRQKLMGVGRDVLRVIPGVRAVGIALSAVKNSDMLRNSIQELKDSQRTGGKKGKAWLKVGGAAVGLLAISAVAAYTNDDVADAVNDFVSNMMGSQEAVDNAIEQISEQAPGLIENAQIIEAQTALADTLATNPALADTLTANQALADQILANPAMVDSLATNPVLADTLATTPMLADTLATNPALVDTLATNPMLVDTLAANPTLTDQILLNPTMVDTLATNPYAVQTFVLNPELEALLNPPQGPEIVVPYAPGYGPENVVEQTELPGNPELLTKATRFLDDKTISGLSEQINNGSLQIPEGVSRDEFIYKVSMLKAYAPYAEKSSLDLLTSASEGNALTAEQMEQINNSVGRVLPSGNYLGAYDKDFSSLSLKESQDLFNKVAHSENPQEAYNQLKELHEKDPEAFLKLKEQYVGRPSASAAVEGQGNVHTTSIEIKEDQADMSGVKYEGKDGSDAAAAAGDKAGQQQGSGAGTDTGAVDSNAAAQDGTGTVVDGKVFNVDQYKIGNTFVAEHANGTTTLQFGQGHSSSIAYKFTELEDGTIRFVQGGSVISPDTLDAEDTAFYNKLLESEKERLQAKGYKDSMLETRARTNAQDVLMDTKIAEVLRAEYTENPSQELAVQYALVAKDAKMKGFDLGKITDQEALTKTPITSQIQASASDDFTPNSGTGKNWADATDDHVPTEIKMSNGGTLTVSESGMRTVKTPNGSLFYKFQVNSNDEMMMGATSSARLTAEEMVLNNQMVKLAENSGMSSGDASVAASKAMVDMKVLDAVKAEYAANPSPEVKVQLDYMENKVASNTLIQAQQNGGKGLIDPEKLGEKPQSNNNLLDKSKLGTQQPSNNTLIDQSKLGEKNPPSDLVGSGAGNGTAANGSTEAGQSTQSSGGLIGEGQTKKPTIENIRFDTKGNNGGIIVSDGTDNGTKISTNTTRSGTTTIQQTQGDGSNSTVSVTKNGNVNVRTNQVNSPDSTVRNVKFDTENKTGQVVLSDGKNQGNNVIVRSGPGSNKVEFETRGGRSEISINNKGKIDISTNMNKKSINNVIGALFGTRKR